MDCAYTNIELIDSINYLEKIIKIMKDIQTNSLEMDEVSKKYGPFLADRVSMISSLKKASIMLSALYISFLKEMIIDKHSNENMNLLIEQEAFDKVMDFTEIRDGKVYLGDTSYETSMRCLDVIRNKLLHGDYIFDGESIQFIHEGNKAILPYRLLSKLKDELYMIRHCKGRTISKKIYIVRDLITNTLEEIELKFKTRGSNKLTFDMAVMFEKILKEIQRNNYKISYNPDKCVNLAIDKVKHLKAYNKLDIKYGKKTINQEKEDELLKSIPKDKLKDKYHDQYLRILNSVNSSSDDFIIGCYNELFELTRIATDSMKYIPIFDYERIELALSFLKFYALFNYGNDELLSKRINTNLYDVLSNNNFDYSIMDLDLLHDPNMTIDEPMINFDTQVNGIYEAEEATRLTLETKLEMLNNIKNSSNPNEQAIERLSGIIESIRKDYEKKRTIREKYKQFDKDKYIRNINIINHIRNCFAHGNYEIIINDYFDESKNMIHLFDKHEGVMTYETTVPIPTFKSMFKYEKDILSVLKNKLTTDPYEQRLNIIKNNPNIEDHLKEDWNNLVDKYGDINNPESMNKLEMINFYINELINPCAFYISKSKFIEKYIKSYVHLFKYLFAEEMYDEEIKVFGVKMNYSEYIEIMKDILILVLKEQYANDIIDLLITFEKQFPKKQNESNLEIIVNEIRNNRENPELKV